MPGCRMYVCYTILNGTCSNVTYVFTKKVCAYLFSINSLIASPDCVSQHIVLRDVHLLCGSVCSSYIAPSKETPICTKLTCHAGKLAFFSLTGAGITLLPLMWMVFPFFFDVDGISLLQQQNLGEASSTPGHALKVGVISEAIFPPFIPLLCGNRFDSPCV